MNSANTSEVKKIILKVMNDDKPKTVKQLIAKTVSSSGKEEQEVYEAVRELEKEKAIHLGAPKIERDLPKTLNNYIFKRSYYAIEFWIIVSFIVAFLIIGILVEPDSPFSFLRVIVGSLAGLFIPGWVTANLIFPKIYEKIDQLERVLISLGINIGVTIFIGLLLDQIWAINSMAYVTALVSFTLIVHIASVVLRILLGSEKIKINLPKIKFFKKRGKKDEN